MDAKSLTSASLAARKSAIGAKVDTARRAHYDLGAYLDEARLIEFVGITSAYWSPAHEDLSDVGFTTIIAGKCGPRRRRRPLPLGGQRDVARRDAGVRMVLGES